MRKQKEKIMYDDERAATLVQKQVYRSLSGRYYDDEHMARWDSCTHKTCECGNEMEKMYTKCKYCRDKDTIAKYEALPKKEWDHKTPLCTYDNDVFFSDLEEIHDYCHDHELSIDDLMLVWCKPDDGPVVDIDIFQDHVPSDSGEPNGWGEIEQAINALNKCIEKNAPYSWWPSNIAATITERNE